MKKNLISEMLFAGWLMCWCIIAQPIFAQTNTKLVFPTPAGFNTSQATAVTPTSDGGFLLVGSADATNWSTHGLRIQPRILKLSANLTTDWDETYFTPPPGQGTYFRVSGAAVEMPNGDFAVCISDDSSQVKIDYLRVTAAGAVVHTLDLPDNAWQTTLHGVLPNGNALLTRNEWGLSAFKIYHIDANGSVAFEVVPQIPNSINPRCILLTDGTLLVVGGSPGTNKTNFFKIDAQGNLLWSQLDVLALVQNLVALPNGGFAYRTSGSGFPAWRLAMFDGAGNSLGLTPDLTAPGSNINIVGCPDGAILVSGQTNTQRGFLQKMNLDGTVVWAVESPEDGQAHLTFLNGAPTADGWAAGAGVAVGNQMGFLRVAANTGIVQNIVFGKVGKDDNQNCEVDAGEKTIGIAQIKATDGSQTFYTYAYQTGSYSMALPAGNFTFEVEPTQLFFELCPTVDLQVNFPAGSSNTVERDFPMQSQQTIHSISGKVVLDDNDNCLIDAAEIPLQNWQMRLEQGNNFINFVTDAQGNYTVFVSEGTYSVRLSPLNSNFGICGQTVRTFTLTGSTPQNVASDYVAQRLVNCPIMQTSIQQNTIRPCSTQVVYVNYRNVGTLPAQNATLTVSLPSGLEFVSAQPTPTSVNGNQLLFNLGDLPPSYGYSWNYVALKLLGDCDLQIGQQLCLSSAVTPNTPCTEPQNWLGAIIEVTGECQNDDAVFTIKNIGVGNQVSPLDFVIVEDQIVLLNGNFNLQPGQSQMEVVMNLQDSTTLTIVAQQEPGAPAPDPVVFNLTNCNGTVGGNTGGNGGTPGIFSAQGCLRVVNSYDPNDKDAYPYGFGDQHIVRPGMPLDYTIRFQNTGNDTAFTVVLRDTLDKNFDFSRLELLGSSHRFQFSQIENSVLHFRFDQILLPDSATNPAASQGFVQFRVYPKANLPLGTVVKNRAAIYFDYNPPIITNTVARRYDEYWVVSTDQPNGNTTPFSVVVAPNPFVSHTIFSLPTDAPAGNYLLQLFDISGKLLHNVPFQGHNCRVQREELPSAGTILWRIFENGHQRASGKIVAGE